MCQRPIPVSGVVANRPRTSDLLTYGGYLSNSINPTHGSIMLVLMALRLIYYN